MKSNTIFLFLLGIFVSQLSVAQNKVNLPPIINEYITLASPTQLDAIRVDLSKSFDPDGTIVKTEVNFGDGFISSQINTTHTYSRGGKYQISIKAWDNKNAVSVVSRLYEQNADFKLTNVTNSSVLGGKSH